MTKQEYMDEAFQEEIGERFPKSCAECKRANQWKDGFYAARERKDWYVINVFTRALRRRLDQTLDWDREELIDTVESDATLELYGYRLDR